MLVIPSGWRHFTGPCSSTSLPKRSPVGRGRTACGVVTCSGRQHPRRTAGASPGRSTSTGGSSSSGGLPPSGPSGTPTGSCSRCSRASSRTTPTHASPRKRWSYWSSFRSPPRLTPGWAAGRGRWAARRQPAPWRAAATSTIRGCEAQRTASRATSPSICAVSSCGSRSGRHRARPCSTRLPSRRPSSPSRCSPSFPRSSGSAPVSSSGWATISRHPRLGGRSTSSPGRSS